MLTEKSFAGKPTEAVEERLAELIEYRKVTIDRARVADSKAIQVLLEDFEHRRNAIRSEYLSINTLTHANAVVAALADLQGQEKQISNQIHTWKNMKKAQKEIDEAILICEKVLSERRKQKQ